MKFLRSLLTTALLLVAAAAPAATSFPTPETTALAKNATGKLLTGFKTDSTAPVQFLSGATVTFDAGSTLTIAGNVTGTPGGGTLNLSLVALTLSPTTSGLTKTTVGLSNVDNTSDAAKPVSSAQAAAIAAAEAASQPADPDLAQIAALATTGYGRSLLIQASSAAARTTLNADLGPQIGFNRVVLLGDSLSSVNGGPGSSSPLYMSTSGWFTWANIRLGHRLVLVNNAGVAGERVDQMLARFASSVTAYSPSIVTVLGGTNDVSQSRSYDLIIADLAAIYDSVYATGALCLAIPIPPITTLSDANRTTLQKVNRWIKEQARQRKRFVVSDIGAAIVDPSTSTFSTSWSPASGMTSDGIHPTPAAAPLMGRIFADDVSPYLARAPLLFQGNADVTNLVTNGGIYGTGTSSPTGWGSSSDIGTWSYVARSDGVAGNWAQFTLAGAGFMQMASTNITSGFSTGDKIYVTIEYETTYTPGTVTSFYLALYRNGSNVAADPSTFAQAIDVPTSGVLETMAYTVPASTTALRGYLFVTSTGGTTVVKVGRFAMRKGDPLAVTSY
jgi:lysophospholipase L1-like esterase